MGNTEGRIEYVIALSLKEKGWAERLDKAQERAANLNLKLVVEFK